MLLKSILIYIFLLLASPIAVADFSKKIYTCDEEELNDVTEDYNRSPNNVFILISYGRCLVINGYVGEGMMILDGLSKNGAVPAAYFIAIHSKTGGALTIDTDFSNIDIALDDFFYVRDLINNNESYPYHPEWSWRVYEYNAQMELDSLNIIPLLYRYRFQAGATNLENDYINHSTGSKYEETVGSLEAVIEYATECVNTPPKNHFKPEKYEVTIKACQILLDEAIALKPLEEQRLEVLRRKKCSREGLLNCEAYKTLKDKMLDIIRESSNKTTTLFNAYNKKYANN